MHQERVANALSVTTPQDLPAGTNVSGSWIDVRLDVGLWSFRSSQIPSSSQTKDVSQRRVSTDMFTGMVIDAQAVIRLLNERYAMEFARDALSSVAIISVTPTIRLVDSAVATCPSPGHEIYRPRVAGNGWGCYVGFG
jgi:hypothetical protein